MTAAFYAEFDSNYVQLNRKQGYKTVHTTSVQQVEHYGQSDEHKLPPDKGAGYLWRLMSLVRFEQRDGGTYLEMEVIALSRDFPRSLQFLLKPVIDRVPREDLEEKLEQIRDATKSQATRRERLMSLGYDRP